MSQALLAAVKIILRGSSRPPVGGRARHNPPAKSQWHICLSIFGSKKTKKNKHEILEWESQSYMLYSWWLQHCAVRIVKQLHRYLHQQQLMDDLSDNPKFKECSTFHELIFMIQKVAWVFDSFHLWCSFRACLRMCGLLQARWYTAQSELLHTAGALDESFNFLILHVVLGLSSVFLWNL